MTKSIHRVLALSALLALSSVGSHAAESVKYQAQPGSSVRIDGTSTLHDWTVESTLIGGMMELNADSAQDLAQAQIDPKVHVVIPVRSLKSGKSPMDNVMHKAMNIEKHPRIEYKLTEMKPKKDADAPENAAVFDTKGELTVAGVKRPVQMDVVLLPNGTDQLKASGTTTLKMTDFGIDPPAPALALGLIKTGDEVKISFEWLTKKSK